VFSPPLRRLSVDARLAIELDRARIAANDPMVLPARLSCARGTLSGRIARALPPGDRLSARLRLASSLGALGEQASGDAAARATGTAYLLGDQPRLALDAFDRVHRRDAHDWNDVAAANICAARQDGHPDRWLAALAAADRALVLDPLLIEAAFNRVTVIDALAITPAASRHWRRYLQRDRSSPWSRIARQRLASFKPADSDAWKAATIRIQELSAETLARLTNHYPQAARRYADVLYLSSWAAAMAAGRRQEAEAQLIPVRVIARALAVRGEPLLVDALTAIDRAAVDPGRLKQLVAGQLAYQRGRLKLRDGQPIAADDELRTAARRFAGGGSPMVDVAEFWVASALTEQNRTAEALELLTSLLARQLAAGHRYPSLIGHVQYQLSLAEASHGNWTASLTAAQGAKAAFASIGERGNLGNANAMLAEDYDLLGQPELAWMHGFEALRDSAADGAFDRTRVTLASLCRTELRGGRWDRAHSLAGLEAELDPLTRDVRLDPDMFIRRAVAEWHLGGLDAARASIRLARGAVMRINDATIRMKLLADVDAAEGTFARRGEPERAVALLSAAVAFQKESERPIVLPELYLERGRTYLAANDLSAAERDFEAGLAELERQRSRVREAELRPGIFDDAAKLFNEAIALQIRRGSDAHLVWRYVERGRARAVLEQINAGDERLAAPELPSMADVQRDLTPATALLEYVSLPDNLVVFVITRDRVVMRTLPTTREALMRAAREFVDHRGVDGRALYDVLIAPLRDELRGVQAINVVTDDILQRVPFAALFDQATRTFLVQRYTIATSPSAAVLLATLARLRLLPLRQVQSALIFANPAIPREQFGDLPSLTAAEYEAPKIARHYARADVFIGDSATAERFFELAPSRDLVYFSGHGVLNEREPFASALICASTPRVSGGVTSRAIARMKFRSTRAVVLAACSTMTGRNAAIEGVPSLARAFVVAGVPAVVGTLWDIEDHEAAAVTHPLHEQLARGVAPAEALRSAQIRAIGRGLPISSWSAFALMGNAAAAAH